MSGWGVPQSDEEAIRWYRKSVDRGDAEAQYRIGTMYLKGRSVERDLKKAAEWYMKAAEQGHEKAIEAIEGAEALLKEAEKPQEE